MWERILFWAGISVQLFGVGLTSIGAWWVWQEVRSSSDRFLAPFIEAWEWLAQSVRRLIRGPAPQVIHVNSISGTGTAGKAGMYTSPAKLPDGLSVDDRIALVHDQLRTNIGKIYKQMFQIDADLQEEIKQSRSEQKLALEAADARDEEERRRAVSAVRLEAYGFFLLTVETMLQAWGSYLGID